MKLLADLFLTFAKVGLFTFGGGYAMISIIENACVEQKKWITHDEMMNITVIAESTPGPIAINAATYVGYKQAGIPGSVFATIGMVLPSFIIIYLISSLLDNFLEIQWIANAFKGIRVGVGLLILRVALQMLRKLKPAPQPRIIAGCAFAVMLVVNFLALNFSTITLMLIAGAAGLAIFLGKEKKGGGRK
jgi:chromate transporter